MRRRTELTILATILLFVLLASLIPVFFHTSYQNVNSYDFWSHLTRVRQLEVDHFINYEVDYTNTRTINGPSQFYPPGFGIFLYSIKDVSGIGYSALGLISAFIWAFFVFLIYLISRKLLNNGTIALFASVLTACFISGTNMLGPLYSLPPSFCLNFILLSLLVLLFIKDKTWRIIIASLLLSVVFLSHRPSTAMWFLMLICFTTIPILFIRGKQRFIEGFAIPAITVTIIAFGIALIHWASMPMDTLMRFGGITPTRIDELFGLDITKQNLIIIIYLLTLFIFFIGTRAHPWNINPLPSSEPPVYKPISTRKIVFLSLLLPLILFIILGYYLISTTSYDFSSLIGIWTNISEGARHDATARLIRQILYIWHWNIIPVMLFIPSMYLILRSNRRHGLLLICASSLLLIILSLSIKYLAFDIKIERIYLYLAPFAFIIVAWGIYAIIKGHKRAKALKTALAVLVVISAGAMIYSIPSVVGRVDSNIIDGLTWTSNYVPPNDVVITTDIAVYGRGLGQFNYFEAYGYKRIVEQDQLLTYIHNTNGRYTFSIWSETNQRMHRLDRYLLYTGGDIEIFLV